MCTRKRGGGLRSYLLVKQNRPGKNSTTIRLLRPKTSFKHEYKPYWPKPTTSNCKNIWMIWYVFHLGDVFFRYTNSDARYVITFDDLKVLQSAKHWSLIREKYIELVSNLYTDLFNPPIERIRLKPGRRMYKVILEPHTNRQIWTRNWNRSVGYGPTTFWNETKKINVSCSIWNRWFKCTNVA